MRVLMIITGGIAAYKSLYTIRLLKTAGLAVRCIMTPSAQQFITPLSVSALTGERVYTDLFSLTDESEMGHIRLSREADLVLVSPATADIMARTAQGMADDLATTTLLATSAPVFMTPAMNPFMWDNPATQSNVSLLQQRGMTMIYPTDGDMACGETGTGRMAEPAQIAKTVLEYLHVDLAEFDGKNSGQEFGINVAMIPENSCDLAGYKILVTAGATTEDIDGVRYLSNYSSGKQGYAIATALAERGALVTLVSGKTHLPCPFGVERIGVTNADDMLQACEQVLPVHGAVFCAAVADWKVANPSAKKIKKQSGQCPQLQLVENPDILRTIAMGDSRPSVVVGFAAETENIVTHAQDKLSRKNADLIVANQVAGDTHTFGGDTTTVHFVTPEGVVHYKPQSKYAVGQKIADFISEKLCKIIK